MDSWEAWQRQVDPHMEEIVQGANLSEYETLFQWSDVADTARVRLAHRTVSHFLSKNSPGTLRWVRTDGRTTSGSVLLLEVCVGVLVSLFEKTTLHVAEEFYRDSVVEMDPLAIQNTVSICYLTARLKTRDYQQLF